MIKDLLIKCVIFYQRHISPLFPSSCRFSPTCSNYMINAIKIHGSIKGLLMGIARIIRCNPLNKTGIDPVPKNFTIFRNKEFR